MGFRVLVAEPASGARSSLLSLLRNEGAQAEAVDSLHSAFREVNARRYDLVCTDLALSAAAAPGWLRPGRFEAPLIVTGDADTVQAHRQARDCGALGYLARPYAELQLRTLMRQAMARGRHRGVPAEPPRILMYSHDTIGLGHVRRNANIAAEILGLRPDASILMLVGCPGALVFDLPEGVDFVKLPSLVKQSRNRWRPHQLNITCERARELRERLIREAIGAFDPHVILVDHMPTGVWNELNGILAELRRRHCAPQVILGLRDILDTPQMTRRHWRKSGADRAIAEHYDEVLVYGLPALFDTVRAYELDKLAPGRVSSCGHVAAPADPVEAALMRARLAPDDRPLALIAGGGGRDAFPVIDAALAGLAELPPERRPAAAVVAGPLMPDGQRAQVRSRAGALGAVYFHRVANFPALLAASDFLLGMAGYNSVIEAAACGVPALVVPRRGPSAEQMIRARAFANQGLVEALPPEQASPEALGARLAAVGRAAPRVPRLDADGARVAAARIIARLAAAPADGGLVGAV